MEQNLSDKQKQYIVDLKSNDAEKLLTTLSSIREDGSVELFPALFDVYQSVNNDKIAEAFLNIIMDVKDKRAPEIIANELFNRDWDESLAPVLSSIWQSGLDYGPQIEVFVGFVKNENLNVCMEALTCIEEFFYNNSVTNRNEVRQMLKDVALESSGSHQDLVMIYLENLK